MDSPTKSVTIKTSDNVIMIIPEAVAKRSLTIKRLIEDLSSSDDVIPLTLVTEKILAMVVQYCNKHVDFDNDANSTMLDAENLKAWDAEFLKVDREILFDLILAANYLDIPDLLNCTSQIIADMIQDMTLEEVRLVFNIENDFTPEEEEELRKENEWAFE